MPLMHRREQVKALRITSTTQERAHPCAQIVDRCLHATLLDSLISRPIPFGML